jgi:Putative prokaryotic signal transducing protein
MPDNIILYYEKKVTIHTSFTKDGHKRMDTSSWVFLGRIGGTFNAEILKGLFEAQDIQIELYQEAAGKSVFPVNFGMLGEVDIYVKEADLEAARQILAEIDMAYITPEDDEDDVDFETEGPEPEK